MRDRATRYYVRGFRQVPCPIRLEQTKPGRQPTCLVTWP